ncbi:MAG: HD domain-containing protein, partial [Deltaproteobacteria bacterium]|nr:HD domain-containing protein [Deltaproteobacteria bacterium]
VWELSGSRASIGRDPICDIIIKDPKASRIHAEIIRDGNDFVFYDKDSLNGSCINNDRVTQQVLAPGDQIRIGRTTLQVSEDGFSSNIDWDKEEVFSTTRIPLDAFASKMNEVASTADILSKEHQEAATEREVRTAKLIRNLDTLYQVGRTINSIQTVDLLMQQIAKTLFDVFSDVQMVSILLKENGEDLEAKLIETRVTDHSVPLKISWSVINEAVTEEVCILAKDASLDDRFSASESILAINLRSVMCAPLVNRGAVLGVIYLDNREKPDCFDEDDVALLSALANQSAVAIDNSRLYEEIQQAYHEAILALMNTVEAKDHYTRGHSQRTSRYALSIAQELGLTEEECDQIETAAELHDIGKVGVKDLIIGKESTLSTMEFHSIQAHVLTGESIIKPIQNLYFTLPMIRHHHEHYDGSGYPDGLRGKAIPLGAKIIGVADAFDAMTTQRPYNEPLSFKEALKEIQASKGKQFDPDVVDALVSVVNRNYEMHNM